LAIGASPQLRPSAAAAGRAIHLATADGIHASSGWAQPVCLCTVGPCRRRRRPRERRKRRPERRVRAARLGDETLRRHAARRFEDFAKPGGGDERPYGIRFHEPDKPGGLVVASFIVEEPMPLEMSLLAADLVHNTRVALDHVPARLKDHFGGDASQGSFPTW
jgi:hypothetical protein